MSNTDQKVHVCVGIHFYMTVESSVNIGTIHIRLLISVICVGRWVGNWYICLKGKRKRQVYKKENKQKDHPHSHTPMFKLISYTHLWKCMNVYCSNMKTSPSQFEGFCLPDNFFLSRNTGCSICTPAPTHSPGKNFCFWDFHS